MELLKVDALEEAKAKLVKATQGKEYKKRKIAIKDALSHVLAEDVVAPFMIPDFRRSTVDGYAVIAKDTWGADESTPVFLRLVEEVEMGHKPQKSIHPGECAYVPTGGMLPDGASGMVMVEYGELFDASQVAVHASVAEGSHVVEIGEDLKTGETILTQGHQLEPKDVAALAAVGICEVLVYEQPVIVIISTGDELARPEGDKGEGQVYDINTYGLWAMAKKHQFIIAETKVMPDEEELLLKAVKQAMGNSDIVLVSGGSSQGKKDVTKKVLDEASTPGGVFTHGLAVKPGKPTILGYDRETETILVGLPGHPVAAMLVFELIVLAYYQEQFGMKKGCPLPAVMETNLATAPGKTTCQLVEIVKKNGGYLARPIFGKSGLISTLSKADGYLLIDRNKEGIHAGTPVMVHLL